METTLNELTWVNEVIPADTNIVVAVLNDANKRDEVIAQLAKKEIKIMAFGPGMLRFVTHLDISTADIDQTIEALKQINL